MKYIVNFFVSNFLCILLILFFIGSPTFCQTFEKNDTLYHSFQAGIELGIGDNSSPGTRFPFGTSAGVFCRFKNHIIGVRRDYYSDFQIFQAADYYKNRNLYYGYSIKKKNTSFSPQFGMGYINTNHYRPNKYGKVCAEISTDATAHIRGNGIGIRMFYLFSGKINYVGFALHTTLGWTWGR